MVGPVYKACKQCSFISEEDTCPRCGGQTSREWQGYLVVIDYEKSDIAKQMGISSNGKYALRGRWSKCPAEGSLRGEEISSRNRWAQIWMKLNSNNITLQR
ncbi:transcription elongation factor subunit Spt4 [Candidatus Methanarcanum hacksteinii]|uniref:transcription elongation factor subunit Spt4 n=1 Tax=Candidatus Methanarcanum hacksteinii TaxID=2911857 RepID=UPI0037DCAEDB